MIYYPLNVHVTTFRLVNMLPRPSYSLYIVFTGGMLGIIYMLIDAVTFSVIINILVVRKSVLSKAVMFYLIQGAAVLL